jgi:hypothetical protein
VARGNRRRNGECQRTLVGFPGDSLNDLPDPKIENGVLRFSWVDTRNHLDYVVNYVNGALEGEMTGSQGELKFTGHRAPVIDEHDDGAWVKGKPITLFNGKDLAGWKGLKSNAAAGWTIDSGVLKSTGHADDLITADKYWNFELHVEYNVAEHSNSGVGLRGRYEVQIIDDFGKPPGLHGTGTLYTRIVPPANYGKPAGQWQTLDIRLVGMEVTGTLNGNKLYEKGVIDGLTGIAFDPYEGKLPPPAGPRFSCLLPQRQNPRASTNTTQVNPPSRVHIRRRYFGQLPCGRGRPPAVAPCS